MNVSFLGLGVMGFPMAGHLSRCGFVTTVYNRTFENAQRWVNTYSGFLKNTPLEAVSEADIVFLCLGNDDDVRSIVLGNQGLLGGMKSGAVLVDHTTVSAKLAIELSEYCQKQNVEFLDAPVSGGQAGAESGKLTVMVGGAEKSYNTVLLAIESYAQKVLLMGPVGHGQLTKMVNQIILAGLIQGLSEGLSFAEKSGLNTERVVEVISKGAAQSWQMDNRALTMLDRKFDYGFALDWMRKDLAICLDAGNTYKASLPVTALVDQFYKELQRQGKGRQDTSSLIELLGEGK